MPSRSPHPGSLALLLLASVSVQAFDYAAKHDGTIEQLSPASEKAQAGMTGLVLGNKGCGVREITEAQTGAIVTRLQNAVDEKLKKMEATLLKEMESKLQNLEAKQENVIDGILEILGMFPIYDNEDFEHKLESYLMKLDPIVAIIGITFTTLCVTVISPAVMFILRKKNLIGQV